MYVSILRELYLADKAKDRQAKTTQKTLKMKLIWILDPKNQ